MTSSKTIGKHTFKTGVDYIWTPFMGGFFEFNPTLEIDLQRIAERDSGAAAGILQDSGTW